MINLRDIKRYCSEPIELIENYDKAVADTTQTWHLHHRWETDFSYSMEELKGMGEYYGVTADKLIFLTPSEHSKLHGLNISEETRKKYVESHIGKTFSHTEETKRKIGKSNSKPILQYTLDGEFVKEWDSAYEIQRQTGFWNQNINGCCRGKFKTAYKYIWRYK